MIQRNDQQVSGRTKNPTRVDSRIRVRRPQLETERYDRTPGRLALFTEPPRDKPVYTIGELVVMAYERAGLLAEDAATEALVATRLLAEWLILARATTPLADTSAEPDGMPRTLARQQSETRMRRVPSRRSVVANARGFRAAA